MSDPIYAVLLHVRSPMLPTVLQALERSATLVSVTPTTSGKEPPPKKNQHYANGKRMKGISGRELVLQTLDQHNGFCNNQQLEKAFIENGFAKESYSSPVSYLVAEGRVRRLDQGRIARIGTTIHLGADQK